MANGGLETVEAIVLALGLALAACEEAPNEPAGDLPDDREPGTFVVGLEHDGLQREAVVFVPESYDASASTPVVLNFHGFSGIASGHLEWADLRPQAEAAGALLIYPQGSLLDGQPHWNPVPAGGDNKSSVDDLGFVEALLDTVQAAYPFDAGRVSAVGYSNGGMMAMGLACLRSDLIASAGSVSGAVLDTDCDLRHPVSFLSLHGTDDGTIAYEGGDGYVSVLETVEAWRLAINASPAEPVSLDAAGASVDHWAHEGGDNGSAVHHYRVNGGGHVWFDFTVEGEEVNDIIFDFLTAFSVEGRL